MEKIKQELQHDLEGALKGRQKARERIDQLRREADTDLSLYNARIADLRQAINAIERCIHPMQTVNREATDGEKRASWVNGEQETIDKAPEHFGCRCQCLDAGDQAEAGPTPRTEALEDLLRAAHCIAERKGRDTAWERFAASCRGLGIGSVTPRTYYSDQKMNGGAIHDTYLPPTAQVGIRALTLDEALQEAMRATYYGGDSYGLEHETIMMAATQINMLRRARLKHDDKNGYEAVHTYLVNR